MSAPRRSPIKNQTSVQIRQCCTAQTTGKLGRRRLRDVRKRSGLLSQARRGP